VKTWFQSLLSNSTLYRYSEVVGRPPRGSALSRFWAAVHVVKAHGLLTTLRAASSAAAADGARRGGPDEEEEVDEDDESGAV
jgi:hypothetical protein